MINFSFQPNFNLIESKLKLKLQIKALINSIKILKMSGKFIETCYICSERSPRSYCYNVQIGYKTVFCCSIECCTIVNSYLYASSHYKTFSLENVDKAVDHYCYSNRCRASDYNLNVSLIKRVCKYYCLVRFQGVKKDFNYLKSLFDHCVGDKFSQDDSFDDEFDDDFFFP